MTGVSPRMVCSLVVAVAFGAWRVAASEPPDRRLDETVVWLGSSPGRLPSVYGSGFVVAFEGRLFLVSTAHGSGGVEVVRCPKGPLGRVVAFPVGECVSRWWTDSAADIAVAKLIDDSPLVDCATAIEIGVGRDGIDVFDEVRVPGYPLGAGATVGDPAWPTVVASRVCSIRGDGEFVLDFFAQKGQSGSPVLRTRSGKTSVAGVVRRVESVGGSGWTFAVGPGTLADCLRRAAEELK